MSVGCRVGAVTGVPVPRSVGAGSACCVHATVAASTPINKIAIPNRTGLERIITETSICRVFYTWTGKEGCDSRPSQTSWALGVRRESPRPIDARIAYFVAFTEWVMPLLAAWKIPLTESHILPFSCKTGKNGGGFRSLTCPCCADNMP